MCQGIAYYDGCDKGWRWGRGYPLGRKPTHFLVLDFPKLPKGNTMNTVERVARALVTSTEYNAQDDWPIWQDDAKAALNALADGMEWRDNTIYLNGRTLGDVFRVANQDGEYIGFRFALLGTNYTGLYNSIAEAREALMTAARKWLIGD